MKHFFLSIKNFFINILKFIDYSIYFNPKELIILTYYELQLENDPVALSDINFLLKGKNIIDDMFSEKYSSIRFAHLLNRPDTPTLIRKYTKKNKALIKLSPSMIDTMSWRKRAKFKYTLLTCNVTKISKRIEYPTGIVVFLLANWLMGNNPNETIESIVRKSKKSHLLTRPLNIFLHSALKLALNTCMRRIEEENKKYKYHYYEKTSNSINTGPENQIRRAFMDLELAPTKDLVLIKKQYRKLASKYHPDRAPSGKIEDYNQTMARINASYDYLCENLVF